MNRPLLFAHRGESANAPENTIPAFELAIRTGADGIETDAQMTADGHVVLIHDENTLRTTGFDGRVSELTLAEITKLDAGAWFDDKFTGVVIPELWQLLELVRSTNLVLNIELKNSYIAYPGLEEAVLKEVKRFEMSDQVHYSSFNHRSLAKVSGLCHGAETAPLFDAVLHDVAGYVRSVGATAIHPYWRNVNRAVVEDCHAAGIKVRPWTVNDEETALALATLDVDGIITNVPGELMAALR